MPVFEPPSSSRDVGYVSKERCGYGRVRELKGRPARCVAEGVKTRIPSAISISRAAHSFFVTAGPFINRRKMSFRRKHPLSLIAITRHRTYAVPSHLPAWVWTHRRRHACFHLACGFGGGADGNGNGYAQRESESIRKGNSCHT